VETEGHARTRSATLGAWPAKQGRSRRHVACEVSLSKARRFDASPTKERLMGNAHNRGEGFAEEMGGKVKKGIGKAIGNEQMEAEGKAKELKGEGKQEAAKAAERTEGKVEETKGTVKNRVGAFIGNEQMQAEGKAEELKGDARQKANK
jgi:uncharacterized protein YjbJ (UPF0337 family)